MVLGEFFVRGQHVVQVFLGLWGGAVSYVAIAKLSKYETTAKKLAEWSKQAAHELHKTRTTQATGALAILASLVVSLLLACFPTIFQPWLRIIVSPALLLGIRLARSHIKHYWAPRDGKTVGMRIPLPQMGDYNEAQRRTQDLLQILEYLEYSWIVASIVHGVIPVLKRLQA